MKYYILQFKFLTPVHFGTPENKKSGNLQSFNCCADTFFSALITETAALDGELCSRFIEAVQKGRAAFQRFSALLQRRGRRTVCAGARITARKK